MTDTNPTVENQLIELLASRFQSLYTSNSVFHYSVNNLAQMLPPMVAGLAGAAEIDQQRIDKEIEAISKLSMVELLPDEMDALQRALDRIEEES